MKILPRTEELVAPLVQPRPITSLGHEGCEEFSEGPKFLKLFPTFFQEGSKKFSGGQAPLVTGLVPRNDHRSAGSDPVSKFRERRFQ